MEMGRQVNQITHPNFSGTGFAHLVHIKWAEMDSLRGHKLRPNLAKERDEGIHL